MKFVRFVVLVQVFVTGVYLLITDRVGRRKTLLSGAIVMTFSIFAMGVVVRVLLDKQQLAPLCDHLHHNASGNDSAEDVNGGWNQTVNGSWNQIVLNADYFALPSASGSLKDFTSDGITAAYGNPPTEQSMALAGHISSTVSKTLSESPAMAAGRWLALVAVLVYVAGYAIGFGPG